MSNNRFGMTSWDEVEIKQPQTQKRNRDLYMRLEDGSNRIRLVTKPFEYWVHRYKADEHDPGFGERIMSSYPLYGADPLMDEKGMKPKRRWLVGIIDRKTQSYKILDMSVSVFKSIQSLSRDEDWGDPSQYDIDIKVDKEGGATGYYQVSPKPKMPLSAADLELKSQADLEDLKRRCTPPTVEEMKKKIEAVHAKSKNAGSFALNDIDTEAAADMSESDAQTGDDDFSFPSA